MSRKTDPARAQNFSAVLQQVFAAPGSSRKEVADAIRAVGDLGAQSLRSDGSSQSVPPLDADLVNYFEANQQSVSV